MKQLSSVFLDFDDTLSEQITFNLQFCRAIGDYLTPKHGGEPEQWACSAVTMLQCLEAEYVARFRGAPTNGYCSWLAGMRSRATDLLFSGMGLASPPDPANTSVQVQAEALARCNSLFPFARNALCALQTMGFGLNMASGNESAHLRIAMLVLGLDEPIERWYGPDLIDCAKEGPEFYARIFIHAGITPDTAIIVDNDPIAIGWAQAAGAHAIQVNLIPGRRVAIAPGVLGVVTELQELPDVVGAVAKNLSR